MLVIARKIGEAVYVGDARIVLLEWRANGILRLGIEAPPSVKILREELIGQEPPAPVSKPVQRSRPPVPDSRAPNQSETSK